MTARITIEYTGCPIEALERAVAEHGADNAYLLIPSVLWRRMTKRHRKV